MYGAYTEHILSSTWYQRFQSPSLAWHSSLQQQHTACAACTGDIVHAATAMHAAQEGSAILTAACEHTVLLLCPLEGQTSTLHYAVGHPNGTYQHKLQVVWQGNLPLLSGLPSAPFCPADFRISGSHPSEEDDLPQATQSEQRFPGAVLAGQLHQPNRKVKGSYCGSSSRSRRNSLQQHSCAALDELLRQQLQQLQQWPALPRQLSGF